jgi:hypothetical protein
MLRGTGRPLLLLLLPLLPPPAPTARALAAERPVVWDGWGGGCLRAIGSAGVNACFAWRDVLFVHAATSPSPQTRCKPACVYHIVPPSPPEAAGHHGCHEGGQGLHSRCSRPAAATKAEGAARGAASPLLLLPPDTARPVLHATPVVAGPAPLCRLSFCLCVERARSRVEHFGDACGQRMHNRLHWYDRSAIGICKRVDM